MLTKREQDWLEKLIAKKGVKGKYQLRRVLWLNTVKPKFKVGDSVSGSDRSYYICNKAVLDADGVVKELNYVYDNPIGRQIIYKIEFQYKVNGELRTTCIWCAECETKARKGKAKIKDYGTQSKDKCYEAIDPGIRL